MEIDCWINCCFIERNGSLGVNDHRPGLFSDFMDYSSSITVLMVGVWRAWRLCSTLDHKDISEGGIVLFSPSSIVQEVLDHIFY